MIETTTETRIVTGRRVPWAQRDDRNHPAEPHWCACVCDDVVLARCPEHGWQVAVRQTRTVTTTPWVDQDASTAARTVAGPDPDGGADVTEDEWFRFQRALDEQ